MLDAKRPRFAHGVADGLNGLAIDVSTNRAGRARCAVRALGRVRGGITFIAADGLTLGRVGGGGAINDLAPGRIGEDVAVRAVDDYHAFGRVGKCGAIDLTFGRVGKCGAIDVFDDDMPPWRDGFGGVVGAPPRCVGCKLANDLTLRVVGGDVAIQALGRIRSYVAIHHYLTPGRVGRLEAIRGLACRCVRDKDAPREATEGVGVCVAFVLRSAIAVHACPVADEVHELRGEGGGFTACVETVAPQRIGIAQVRVYRVVRTMGAIRMLRESGAKVGQGGGMGNEGEEERRQAKLHDEKAEE